MNQIRSGRLLFRTADLLIINILSIYLFVNFVGEDEILSVVSYEELHMSAASPPVTWSSHLARWQLFPVWNREWTGGVASMTKHGHSERDRERHAVCWWFLPPAQNELSFTRVKIKFTIRMKQTSIGYSVRRYLPIVLFDMNRDSYMTVLPFPL